MYGEGAPAFKEAPPRPLVQRLAPLVGQLRRYRPDSGKRDLVAGITVAALAMPSAMAYAEVAGLQPVNGLYALLLPTVAYALLGSSRQLVIGPEGSLSAMVAVSVLAFAAQGSQHAAELAAMLALLTAGFYVLALIARLGWLADYFSRPVLIGYIHGIAIVLIVGQLGKMLGLSISASDPIPQLVEVVKEIPSTSLSTLCVSVVSLAVLLPLRYLAPRFPAALLVVVGGIAVSAALNLSEHGVAVVGAIPSGLPSISLPRPTVSQTVQLIPAAAGLFLVSFADEILTARSYAQRHNEHIGVTQELRAMAAANAVAGLTQALPVGASGSRTAVADATGARSQISGLVAASAILLILLFLTAPIAHLPKAVLGAAIVSAAIGLIRPESWRKLARTDRVELAIAASTTAGVVIVGVLAAVVFAVALTIIDAVRRSARPGDAVLGYDPEVGRWVDVSADPDAQITPGVVVYRLEDRLFFANVSYVKQRVHEAVRGAPSRANWVVLDSEAVIDVDSTGLQALRELISELAGEGVSLSIARARRRLRSTLDSGGISELVGAEHIHPTVRAAVAACTATSVQLSAAHPEAGIRA